MKALASVATALMISGTASVIACGDDEDAEDDPAVAQIAALSETASYAYTEDGPDGLYDYLANFVTADCSKDELREALDSGLIPIGWRETNNIAVTDETATASVVLITEDGDVAQDWTFALEGESWRVTNIPGVEDCS